MSRTLFAPRLRLCSHLLAFLVMVSLVFGACAPAAAPQPTAKPAAPAPAAQPTAAAAAAKPAATTAAASKEIPIAFIAPLSGPWARQGELKRLGAEMAIEEINLDGGIKALGGAKLVLKVADAGDSTEKAKSAAQRLLSQEKDLVAGIGAWLSSFTLAVTEVSEREQLPWLTLSFADSITERGFKFVFQTSPTSGAQAKAATPTIVKLAETAMGKKPTTVGIISDNTADSVAYFKPLREGGFAQLGLQVVMDETFTPPLSDATPIAQKLRNAKPDFVLFKPSATPDIKLLFEKINEFGLGKGRIPLIASGGAYGTPELLKALGPDLLDGFLVSVGNWPLKGSEVLVERFKKRTNEPWMTQDALSTYGEVWIIKEALEKAGAADRLKVAEALRTMDLTKGPAAESFPGRRVKFDERGRRIEEIIPIYQWQKGVPVTVHPTNLAVAQPIWPKP